MGLLAQHQPPELNIVFHIAEFSKVSVILLKHWLFLRNVCWGCTWLVSLIDWWSVCWGIYPVLSVLMWESLAIAMISIPEEPLNTANISVDEGNGAAGGRSWRWKDRPGHLSEAGGWGEKWHLRSEENPSQARGENRWGPYHLTIPIF